MSAGAQRAPLGPAAPEVLVPGRGAPVPVPVRVPAGGALAFGADVPVRDDSTVGLGTATDGAGVGLCHELPYAAEGSPSDSSAAALDDAVTPEPATGTTADGAGWALPNRQASTAESAIAAPRIKTRRRQ